MLKVQTLHWASIPKLNNLKRIVFQFDVKADKGGHKHFQLVAYPFYRFNNKWKVGEKRSMPVPKGAKAHFFKLPLTLGNLVLGQAKISKLMKHGGPAFRLIPKLYKANPHAEYDVVDSSNTLLTDAKPSPPAPPEA